MVFSNRIAAQPFTSYSHNFAALCSSLESWVGRFSGLDLWIGGYRFLVSEYLAHSAGDGFEMHILAQRSVLNRAQEELCSVLEILEDRRAGEDWI
jgi:hypothetical protein